MAPSDCWECYDDVLVRSDWTSQSAFAEGRVVMLVAFECTVNRKAPPEVFDFLGAFCTHIENDMAPYDEISGFSVEETSIGIKIRFCGSMQDTDIEGLLACEPHLKYAGGVLVRPGKRAQFFWGNFPSRKWVKLRDGGKPSWYAPFTEKEHQWFALIVARGDWGTAPDPKLWSTAGFDYVPQAFLDRLVEQNKVYVVPALDGTERYYPV